MKERENMFSPRGRPPLSTRERERKRERERETEGERKEIDKERKSLKERQRRKRKGELQGWRIKRGDERHQVDKSTGIVFNLCK